jgi:hypothetical protein
LLPCGKLVSCHAWCVHTRYWQCDDPFLEQELSIYLKVRRPRVVPFARNVLMPFWRRRRITYLFTIRTTRIVMDASIISIKRRLLYIGRTKHLVVSAASKAHQRLESLHKYVVVLDDDVQLLNTVAVLLLLVGMCRRERFRERISLLLQYWSLLRLGSPFPTCCSTQTQPIHPLIKPKCQNYHSYDDTHTHTTYYQSYPDDKCLAMRCDAT